MWLYHLSRVLEFRNNIEYKEDNEKSMDMNFLLVDMKNKHQDLKKLTF